MLKNEKKPKKVHWIPPGRTYQEKDKVSSKENLHNVQACRKSCRKTKDNFVQTVIRSKLNVTFDVEKAGGDSASVMKAICSKEKNIEITSVSSNPFDESKDDSSIYLNDIKEEHRVLTLYYMALRPVLQKIKRLIGYLNIKDEAIQELLSKVELELNGLFGSLEELEFLIDELLCENAFPRGSFSEHMTKATKTKQNLLQRLFDCYHDISAIFQLVQEKLSSCDNKELEKERDDYIKKYLILEKKYKSQAAIIKDLERQLSIIQSKYHAVEGYNTTLEETKADFQKMVHDKDVQIRNLASELTKISTKQDEGKWIELLEEVKVKSETDIKALKKALKAQKLTQKIYNQNRKQEFTELENELEKKVQMIVDLASERDKLRVRMTVANNDLIEARYHNEEIKSQVLKLQNKLSECETNSRNQLQGESEVFRNQLLERGKTELKLQNTIRNLEEELNTTLKEFEVLKLQHESIKSSLQQAQNNYCADKVFDEVRSLTSLLQDTREHILNSKASAVTITSDNSKNEKNSDFENLMEMMVDMKKELLEIKRPDVSRNQIDKSSESDFIRQLEELRQKHKAISEENKILKRQLKEMENSSTFPEFAIDENYSANNLESNFPPRDFQLALKQEEIWKYKQREKKLEYQLEEIRDKLQKKEMENVRLFSLEESLRKTEEDLKSKKLELSLLEQRKQEESERYSKRIKDLQEALDESSAKNDSLLRHIEMLKVSLHNVFGES